MPKTARPPVSSRGLSGTARRSLLALVAASAVLPSCSDRASIDLFPSRVNGIAGNPNMGEPVAESSGPSANLDAGSNGGPSLLDASVSSGGATSEATSTAEDTVASETSPSEAPPETIGPPFSDTVTSDTLSDTVTSDSASSETVASDTASSEPAMSSTTDATTVPEPPSLGVAPLHRYDFSGTGTEVVDLMGGVSGVANGGTQLDGSGRLALDGDDDFVELPTRLVSSLTNATFMSWSTWSPTRVNPCWDRVFSFGNAIAGPGTSLVGDSELFVTATGCTPEGNIMVRFQPDPSGLIGLAGSKPFPVNQEQQVALVVDSLSNGALLYLEGDLIGGMLVPVVLAQINDEDNWLGQSLWTQDFNWRGSLNEFRVYDVALSPEQIAAAHQLGPDDPGL